ncbi:MAG: helix-turn-helix transcriptional regulator [Ignavibacteria bacterium]|nr:helix-turn-helix transcriptional regulator [Ignavibacteria bacterium]
MIPYEMKKLGIYLKRLREEADLSIRDVTRKCGIAPSYLSKIEKGDSFSTLSIRTLLKLSKFYNLPIGALLKEAGLVDSDEYELPDLPQYLRAKYHLSPQAIRDMEMAKEIVDKKYRKTFRR